MLARLRRWLRGPERHYYGPGIVLLPTPNVDPDVLPPSVAIVPPEPMDLPDPTITTFRRVKHEVDPPA